MSLAKTIGFGVTTIGAVSATTYLYFNGAPWNQGLNTEEKTILEGFKLPEKCKELNKPCSLNKEELKSINFSNKNDGTDLTIEQGNAQIDLTVSRVSEKEKSVFTDGLKFVLDVKNVDIEIKQSANDTNNKINLKKNTKYEFKKNSSGKLERAWSSVENYAQKIGLSNCTNGAGLKSCSLSNASFNVMLGDGNKEVGVSAKTEDKSKNISCSEEEGYMNGFKFSTPQEIKLEKDSVDKGKLEAEASATYQIQFIGDNWYLTKKN